MTPSELLKMKQVAAELGLSHSQATRLVTKGLLPTVERPGGAATWRVARADLDAYIERVRSETLWNKVRRDERERNDALRDLEAAWAGLSDEEKDRLARQLDPDIYAPLVELARTRPNEIAFAQLSSAYRNRTEDGVIELALVLPHDLYRAVTRIGFVR